MTETRSMHPLRWLVVGLCGLALVFDGYDLVVYGTTVAALRREWGITGAEAGFIASLSLVGMLVGALGIGTLTDLLGRRRTLIGAVVLFSAAMPLCALAQGPGTFAALRLVAGLGLGGVMPIASALVTEYAPPGRRNLTYVLMQSGYAVGGVLAATGRNADAGSGEWFVAEADESDGAFLVYRPHAAVVTNVEADHLDVWGTAEAYHAAFEDFLDRIEPDGFLVCCVDDPGATALAATAREREIETLSVGTGGDAELRATDLAFEGTTSSFTVERAGEELGRVRLQIPGEHYVLDALAALATGLRLGLPFDGLAEGLGAFGGSGRRMELKGEAGGVRVFDSYAHAPAEIAGDLRAARGIAGDGRVVAAFQPHLVSRTRLFGEQMGEALGAADEVVVLDVYLAREDADPEVTGRLVADAVPLGEEHVRFEADFDAVPSLLADLARPGDVVLTLGAGTITELAPRVVGLLEERGES